MALATNLSKSTQLPTRNGGETLVSLCASAAERWHDKVALRLDPSGEVLTFSEIEERSNKIAHALHSRGIARGDRVAVMMRNRSEFMLAWIGIAKLAAAMVPINIYFKSADAGYLLQHSEAKAIVLADEFLPLITDIQKSLPTLQSIFSVDSKSDSDAVISLPALMDQTPRTLFGGQVFPEDLSTIQYTSGTTGKPKGCMISNNYWAVLSRVVGEEMFVGLSPDDVLLCAQPFYYIDPLWNLAACFASGAELIALDRFHPVSFWESVRRYGATFFYCLGVMPRLLLTTAPSEKDKDHKVKLILCSAVPRGQHAEIERRWGVKWCEVFGMTETGDDIVVSASEHDALVGSGSIGRPMRHREARIVDDADRPLPRGATGELVLRGPGMMDGYYKDPEATATALRNGWMHTGDLARMDESGLIYYAGRKKDMIRRSGENISAAEVEDVIQRHPQVRIAACVPVPDDLRGEEVKAYIVLREPTVDKSSLAASIAEFCDSRLAYFKIPRFWTFRDDLPRTASERVAKWQLVSEQKDLRSDSYDRVEKSWR